MVFQRHVNTDRSICANCGGARWEGKTAQSANDGQRDTTHNSLRQCNTPIGVGMVLKVGRLKSGTTEPRVQSAHYWVREGVRPPTATGVWGYNPHKFFEIAEDRRLVFTQFVQKN